MTLRSRWNRMSSKQRLEWSSRPSWNMLGSKRRRSPTSVIGWHPGGSSGSDHDDPSGTWLPTRSERGHELSLRDREGRPEARAHDCEGAAIRQCVGDDQRNNGEPPVADLQVQAAFERLEVMEARFGLDRDVHPDTADDRVPGAATDTIHDWNLSTPAEQRMQTRAKALEQPELAGVPDRIMAGEEADRGRQTGDNGKPKDLVQVHSGQLPALEAADLSVGHASSTPSLPLAEARGQSSVAEFLSDGAHRAAHEPAGSVNRSLAAGHPAMVASTPYLRLNWNGHGSARP